MSRNFDEYRAEVLSKLNIEDDIDVRNSDDFRKAVLTSLGMEYTDEDLTNFEMYRLKVLDGLASGGGSGGGGSSDYTLIFSGEYDINALDSGKSNVATVIPTESFRQKNAIVYVKIRDKAGKRSGYFYGSDQWFVDIPASYNSATTSFCTARTLYTVDSSGNLKGANTTSTYTANDNAYGVTADYFEGTDIIIRRNYNSTSGTINGTFIVEIYLLKWPNDESPLV